MISREGSGTSPSLAPVRPSSVGQLREWSNRFRVWIFMFTPKNIFDMSVALNQYSNLLYYLGMEHSIKDVTDSSLCHFRPKLLEFLLLHCVGPLLLLCQFFGDLADSRPDVVL